MHARGSGCDAASYVTSKGARIGEALGALSLSVLSSLLVTAPPCSARSRRYTSMQSSSAAGMRSCTESAPLARP